MDVFTTVSRKLFFEKYGEYVNIMWLYLALFIYSLVGTSGGAPLILQHASSDRWSSGNKDENFYNSPKQLIEHSENKITAQCHPLMYPGTIWTFLVDLQAEVSRFHCRIFTVLLISQNFA